MEGALIILLQMGKPCQIKNQEKLPFKKISNKIMKLKIDKVMYQLYIFPYLKITYDKWLNGNYEIIVGWMNWAIVLEMTPKK